MRFAIIGALLVLAGTRYTDDLARWRADYENQLKAPDGWLSVAGLYWLTEGANTVERESIRFHAGAAVLQRASGAPVQMKIDTPVPVGRISMTLIQRGEQYAVRVRDPKADTRMHFAGCKWFPADERWRVKAKWVAYPEPRNIAILNVFGMKSEEPSPGYALFTLNGQALRLEPVIEEDHLFFLFKDLTSGKTTYPAGRFLYAAMPRNGEVELDFNKTENPPCAFTAFATCPLPPRQNTLPVAIEAGEQRSH